MKHLLAAIWCSTFLTLQAQEFGMEHCTVLIAGKKYQEALKYCDSFLKKNPNHVDALMMKGNVYWNEGFELAKTQLVLNDNAASIFKTNLPEPVYVPSVSCVEMTEKCWLKCLQIDSNRTDIVKGLCTMYSLALDKESTKRCMLRLKNLERGDEEQVFMMANYARNFIERDRFEEGMELYQYLATLFTSSAGIRADISSEYFFAGRHRECLQWADSVLRFTGIDETSYLNVAFNYSSLGYFDAAQKVLTDYSTQYNRAMGIFYSALRAFADSGNVSMLAGFVTTTDSNAYFKEHELANRIIRYHQNKNFADYKSMIYDAEIPNYYKVLIHQHGLHQWANQCETSAMFGVFHSMLKNYPAAVQFLDVLEEPNCELHSKNDGYWQMHYGYALYMNKQYTDALRVLSNATSTTAFNRESMQHFKALALYLLNKQSEAHKEWQQLASTGTTKYARLAVEELRLKKF